jgi:DNA-directed RNA polymerase omega subunit
MSVTLSRGPSINIQNCVDNVGGNRFNLVIIAAARSRELARAHRRAEKQTQLNGPVQALLEIEAGMIGKEYLLKV